ncbi:ribosome-binding factor A [Mesomycoplasma ovipneumoniae]|uniref:ribosome-binding factor A n=1 Tax=Mesomycoplasma ovipneumoniae TaxID=29562 RepID=UPI002964190D|nr:ribosome-binding factor A [Mesomycoplasma ovipneumoniae]MDW2924794.1 ribosome-binding factor A [Mesomycoplasma ovipneumoniae]
MSVSHEKRQTYYHQLISKIIDTHFSERMPIAVNWVRLSGDNSHLFIYLEFEYDEDKYLGEIIKAEKFIRLKFGNLLEGFKVPELHFKLDPVAKRVDEMDKIFARIKSQDENDEKN